MGRVDVRCLVVQVAVGCLYCKKCPETIVWCSIIVHHHRRVNHSLWLCWPLLCTVLELRVGNVLWRWLWLWVKHNNINKTVSPVANNFTILSVELFQSKTKLRYIMYIDRNCMQIYKKKHIQTTMWFQKLCTIKILK